MLKIKRLKVNQFRRVKPGTEMRFNDRRNILLGENGTGKTSLLKLLSMVARSNFSEIKNEEFSVDYSVATTTAVLSVHIENRRSGPSVDPGTPHQTWQMAGLVEALVASAEIKIEVVGVDGIYEVRTINAEHRVLLSGVEQAFSLIRMEPTQPFYTAAILFGLLPQLGQPATPVAVEIGAYRFDESLRLFEFQEIDETDGFRIFKTTDGKLNWLNTYIPLSVLKCIDEGKIAIPTDPIVVSEEQAPFLRVVAQAMGFEHADLVATLKSQQAGTESGYAIFRFSNFEARFTTTGGDRISQDWLSYGQKRLYAFFYYLACNFNIVIADELVNGLHHAWIDKCLDAMGERQAFLTSQNPLLLDHLEFESVEDVESTFIMCESHENGGGRRTMSWANMNRDEAERFFSAYKVGIQHVGEILRTKGLW